MAKFRIKEVAIEKGKTMSDIFRATGIAQSTLSNINQGKLSPTFETLEKVAEFLEVPLTELIVNEASYIECPYCHKLIRVEVTGQEKKE